MYIMVNSRLVAGRRVLQVLAGPSNIILTNTVRPEFRPCQGYPFGNWCEQLPRYYSLSVAEQWMEIGLTCFLWDLWQLAETSVILTKPQLWLKTKMKTHWSYPMRTQRTLGKGGTRTPSGTQVYLESYIELWAKNKSFWQELQLIKNYWGKAESELRTTYTTALRLLDN